MPTGTATNLLPHRLHLVSFLWLFLACVPLIHSLVDGAFSFHPVVIPRNSNDGVTFLCSESRRRLIASRLGQTLLACMSEPSEEDSHQHDHHHHDDEDNHNNEAAPTMNNEIDTGGGTGENTKQSPPTDETSYPYLDSDGYSFVKDRLGRSAIQNITTATAPADTSDTNPPSRPGYISSPGDEIGAVVRLQDGPDEDVRGISTREDILARIAEVKQRQRVFGKPDLYNRQWVPSESRDSDDDGGRDRTSNETTKTTVANPRQRTGIESLSVAQFNILAEGLSAGPESKTPFPMEEDKTKANDYGGFTQLSHPEAVLDFELRKWRLMEVLLEFDHDIIAIEEMDRYHGFFQPLLKALNYEGIFTPKMRAPGIPLGWYSDGCCLFYRKDRFERLVSQERLTYSVGTQVLIIASLLHKATQQTIVVAVTHLKARQTDKNEAIRRSQVEEMVETVGKFRDLNTSDEPWPVLILGDFNADPPNPQTKSHSAVQLLLNQSYRSAYNLEDGSVVTTWKKRGDEVQRVIDYIFYTPELLECTHTLSIPKEQLAADKDKLPNLRYPSDHLMIAARFKTKPIEPNDEQWREWKRRQTLLEEQQQQQQQQQKDKEGQDGVTNTEGQGQDEEQPS